jgi:hypothetical protein
MPVWEAADQLYEYELATAEAAMNEADASPELIQRLILAVDASGMGPADIPRRL